MSTQEPFVLDSGAAAPGGRPIHGIVDFPSRPGRRPTVVLCHGFKGFMEWGFFPPLADLLVERGFTVVRWNTSGGGQLPGEDWVSDLQAFREATFSKDVEETRRVLEAVASGRIGGDRVDPERLGLLGHSRGGGAAILVAGSPPWSGRLRALVTWAAVSTYQRQDAAVREAWRRDGCLSIVNGRTGQELEIGALVLDDLERHREALDITAAASRVEAPWLIVHGVVDETVPAAEAETLASRAPQGHELLLVPEAGHTFGAVHPFAGPTRELIRVMNATQTWLRRHLA